MNKSTANNFVYFIRESIDPNIDTGIDLGDEAKTSVFVFMCLDFIFGWNPFGEIVPQKSGRGFIDYSLRAGKHYVDCFVEVKKFGASLKPKQIRKYLVTPGRKASDFRVGVLTSLDRWQIYTYSPKVGPRQPVLVMDLAIKKPAHFSSLFKYIGRAAGSGGFKLLRSLHGEAVPVVVHELRNDTLFPKIARTMREKLTRNANVQKVPQNASLRQLIEQVHKGKQWKGRGPEGLTYRELTSSLTSREVAELVAQNIRDRLGGKASTKGVRKNIRAWLNSTP